MIPFPTSAEGCGLVVVENFFDQTIETGLVDVVSSTPNEQLAVLANHLEDRLQEAARYGQQGIHDDLGQRIAPPSGALVHPTAALWDRVPLIGRPRMALLLLIAPYLVVRDPVMQWAASLHHRFPNPAWDAWESSGIFASCDGSPAGALAGVLRGLAPLASLIRSGVVVMAPSASAVFADEGVPWAPEIDTYDDAIADAQRRAWAYVIGEDEEGYDRWELASGLGSLARVTGATPVPDGLEELFPEATTGAPYGVSLPMMELSVLDALSIRSHEEVFYALHAALVDVAKTAGRSAPSEPLSDYAARVRKASEKLRPVEEELKILASRGKLFGAVPAVAGATVRIAASSLLPAVPGFHAGATAITRAAVAPAVSNGEAAEKAQRYVMNLRVAGRL
jgi:hypothetical protein